jgi:hypothetical protein
VNSLLTFHKGQPLDQQRTGYDIIGDPFAGVSHSFQKTASFTGVHWINTGQIPGLPSVFCLPGSAPNCPNVYGGTLRRNQIYGPRYSAVDMSVLKSFSITERVKAQFRVGAAGPGGGDITDTIGDFNGAPGIGPGEAFNMQLGLKILF